MAARRSAVIPGAGASSSTFWWRRCTEQSRSKRWTQWPWRVGEDLDLDVARPQHVLLQQHAVVAEGLQRLAPAGRQRRGEVGGGVDPPHAAPATAGAGLDEHREADAGRLGGQDVRLLVGRRGSRA